MIANQLRLGIVQAGPTKSFGGIATRKNILMVVAFGLAFGAQFAWGQTPEVVTGGHVLSSMMTSDPTSCTVSVTGSLDPAFKGADTVVDLVFQPASCPTCGNGPQVIATSRQCSGDQCVSTVDECTGKFALTIQGNDPSGSCLLHAPPEDLCYFVAHVVSTNRQQCHGATNASGADPSGTAPCSGGYCNPSR